MRKKLAFLPKKLTFFPSKLNAAQATGLNWPSEKWTKNSLFYVKLMLHSTLIKLRSKLTLAFAMLTLSGM